MPHRLKMSGLLYELKKLVVICCGTPRSGYPDFVASCGGTPITVHVSGAPKQFCHCLGDALGVFPCSKQGVELDGSEGPLQFDDIKITICLIKGIRIIRMQPHCFNRNWFYNMASDSTVCTEREREREIRK